MGVLVGRVAWGKRVQERSEAQAGERVVQPEPLLDKGQRRQRRKLRRAVTSSLTLSPLMLFAPAGLAAEPDKSSYTLFNPTPEHLMRDMTTDRPDITETPFTIDAGHLQIESDLFGYGLSRRDRYGVTSRGYHIATANFRLGLTNWSELSVVVNPYEQVKSSGGGTRSRLSGMGAVDVRMKFNLWGNDSFEKPGDTAFAVLPFVTLPTDRDNGIGPSKIEGGAIAMFGLQLTDKFSFGMNNSFHIVRNDDGRGTHTESLNTAMLSYEWNDRVSTYYEVVARFNTRDERGDPVQLAAGFTYMLRKNLQLDGGILFGVTPAADRIAPFIGMSARF